MKNQFFDNQFEISRQREEYRRHADRLTHISDPHLDSLNLDVKNFSASDTPLGVVRNILNHDGIREVDFQYLLTVNAMEKLKATLRLVEAQTALAPQIDEKRNVALHETLSDDRHQIAFRFEKAVTSLAKATENEQNVDIRRDRKYDEMQKSLMDMRQSVLTKLDRIVFHQVDEDILMMEKEELIEFIAEERLHCIELVLEANDKRLRKIDRELYEAAYLIKAKDLALIPDKSLPFAERKEALKLLEEEIVRRKESVTQSLDKCGLRIDACRKYMERVYDMGNDNQDIAQFTPVRYIGAPIRTLFDFSP